MTVDKSLLKRLINADEEAFREVFDLYAPKVYQFVYDYIKEKTETEDLTQVVFVKIWENRGTLDLDKSFEGYIFTIAYRGVLDHAKKKATKLRKITLPLSESRTALSALSSEDFLNKHELDSFYNKALQSLPPKRKEIFLLSRHSGLSNREIATQLGLSVKTVENQMTAALSSLKELFRLSDLCFFPLFLIFFSS